MKQRPQVRIDAKPHHQQALVHHDPARWKVLACGRRWGKTRLGVNECLDVAARGGRAWWVAPSYRMSEVGWRPLRQMGAAIGAEVRRVDRQIILPGGGEVAVRSADNPESLRGEGLDYLVIDECAFVSEAAWVESLRAALSDRQGRAMFISTPKGHNWFWRAWLRGHGSENGHGEWASWQFPTAGNPYIEPSEIAAARAVLPQRVFEQEYLAAFLEDAGGVFRRVVEAATAVEEEPVAGRQYVAGVDVAALTDFTVTTVMDVADNRLVHMDRFNRVEYDVLENRLAALHRRYHLSNMVVEANSIGQGVIDHLVTDYHIPVMPFITSNATKDAIIKGLQSAFEHGEITILNDPTLIGELQAYEMTRLPSGPVRYSAPDGMHDDCVMSLALAWHAVSDSGPLLLWG